MENRTNFSRDEAIAITRKIYGLQAQAESLPSYLDQNFLVRCASGDKYVLKIANAEEDLDFLELQNQALERVAKQVSFCPRIIASLSGKTITQIESKQGARHWVRLISYLPGMPMAQLGRFSRWLLSDLGGCIGKLDRAMADFDHLSAHRSFDWDLAEGIEVVEKYRPLVDDPKLGREIDTCISRYKKSTKGLFDGLPKSIIHNDVNDYNVLVGGGDDLYMRNQQVVGIIDFGDMIYSHTICNLAIGIAYAVLDKTDPLSVAVEMVKGYHQVRPLEQDEIAVLYPLVGLRLCVSACLACHQMRLQPDNKYLAVSQEPIRRTLPLLVKIHPGFAEVAFRKAIGWVGMPSSKDLCTWLAGQTFGPVLDARLDLGRLLVFDLGVENPICPVDPDEGVGANLTPKLFGLMKEKDVEVGIGRYDEVRLQNISRHFENQDPYGSDCRTVHMGMDLFAEAGTRVLAPWPGEVFSRAIDNKSLDHGSMIILKHESPQGRWFYTLYGHLDPDSLKDMQPGCVVENGQVIGRLGAAEVNGGRTPHLHFQLIVDLLELDCDFPAVVRVDQRAFWKEFTLDPNLILRLPIGESATLKRDKNRTLRLRRDRFGPSLRLSYRDPIKMVRGFRQYLFDENARRYLDGFNNVPHVGHCHPSIVEAAARQMSVLNTNTRYLSDVVTEYAEKLSHTFPDPLKVCYFVNSATEGNELALRLARAYTGQRDIIVLDAAYHGHTTSLIDISPYKHAGSGGQGAPDWVHVAPLADDYRGLFRRGDPQAGRKYAQAVGEILDKIKRKDRGPAAFIAESCPSVGGQLFFPPGYLSAVYEEVRKAGGVCIADEVQTGYGRIGSHFYAFEQQGVVPDIVVLGKPIGNGHPISAVITRKEIAEAFDNGMEFFSTFGGNTVSCAVGLAVLNVVLEEDLQSHAARVGDHLKNGLMKFLDKHPIVGDVRGAGLFLGVELVKDRESLEPATEETALVVDLMREEGILIGTDGPYHNVIKIRPPMPFSEENADQLISTLDRLLYQEFGG